MKMKTHVFMYKSDKPFAKTAEKLFRMTFEARRERVLSYNENTFRYFLADINDIVWCGHLGNIISYIGPYVFEKTELEAAKWAINLHPGPPEYPGIGCTNFAMYDGVSTYGVTAHLMGPKVDSGKILMVKEFPVTKHDTLYTLTQKCYSQIFEMFVELLTYLENDILPMLSQREWACPAFTRKQLEELCRITPDMPEDEIKRVIKATTYPNKPGAYVELGGYKFEAKYNDSNGG